MLISLVLGFIYIYGGCRKLAELGFKRSADNCKEKFEEESRYFNNNINYTKNNYRFLSELEEIYQGDQNTDQADTEKSTQQMEKPSEGQDKNMGQPNDTSVAKRCEESEKVEKSKDRKRKRHGSTFEMFKGFCENIVKKMMAQQEEMHNKLLEDILRRDEEKFAREEAWKKQEMDRMNKELEMMAHEQAIAGDRQATIIEFLKKFTPSSQPIQTQLGAENGKDNIKVTNTSIPNTPNSSSQLHSKNPSPAQHASPFSSSVVENQPQESSALQITRTEILAAENPNSGLASITSEVHSSSASIPAPMNPSTFTGQNNSLETSPISTYKEDIGRRWPRDEVLALINLRCSLNNNSTEEKDGTKAPLWERISQGMMELGYKRSAKRCKEKWENINKYFRKTKDVNKKRSLDSRTCPYFHQLSTLYSQAKVVSQSEKPENGHLNSPANHRQMPQETQPAVESDQVGSSGFTVRNVDGGEKTLMQVPALEFEF